MRPNLFETYEDIRRAGARRRNTIRTRLRALSLGAVTGLTALLGSVSAQAQTWEAITDAEALRALMSDTVFEATLPSGAKSVAQYKADGTGVLTTLGETFERTWEIKGADQICIIIRRTVQCYTVERNTEAANEYRARIVDTGETVVFTKTKDAPTVTESPTTSAGGAAKPSADELAQSLANPNTPLASLTFKLQQRAYEGDLPNAGDQKSTTLLFQPSLPFPLENGDLVIFRPAFPLQFDQPVFDPAKANFDSEFGLGDIGFDLAYASTTKDGFLWAVGMFSTLPTATSSKLGKNRLTLGPEVLLGKISKSYVLGAFPNHQWDVAGSGEADVSLTTAQIFATYLPGGGWNVGSSPVLSYDHITSEWTIPLNLTAGKTVVLGGRPWKFQVEANYYVAKPDAFGPQWMIGFNATPIVENVLAGWFK